VIIFILEIMEFIKLVTYFKLLISIYKIKR